MLAGVLSREGATVRGESPLGMPVGFACTIAAEWSRHMRNARLAALLAGVDACEEITGDADANFARVPPVDCIAAKLFNSALKYCAFTDRAFDALNDALTDCETAILY